MSCLLLMFNIRRRIFISLLLVLAVPTLVNARVVQEWTYQEMFDKADLVVIAQVVFSKDTDERNILLDDIKVIGVLTDFKTSLILKGPKNLMAFQFHHYRLQSQKDENIVNGPDLVRIGSERPMFLLFLHKESDGKYAPVTGQTDPASYSVLELKGAAN